MAGRCEWSGPGRQIPRSRSPKRDRARYWTTCEVTACEHGREFGFAVLLGDKAVNNWHYRLAPSSAGTDVTESFRLSPAPWLGVYWLFGGFLRIRRNVRDMTKTLNRIKDVVEAG